MRMREHILSRENTFYLKILVCLGQEAGGAVELGPEASIVFAQVSALTLGVPELVIEHAPPFCHVLNSQSHTI